MAPHLRRREVKKYAGTFIVVALSLGPAFSSPCEAQPSPRFPDVTLDVGVRQRVDGKFESGIHLIELSCYESGCSLRTISLDQCNAVLSLPFSFTASAVFYSTRDRTLEVEASDDQIIARYGVSDIGGEAKVDLRFGYSPFGVVARLTSFSGGYSKRSAAMNRVITAEYIPFEGQFSARRLECPVLVPGVWSEPPSK